MRGRKRKIFPNTFQHIFQRAVDQGVLFFSDADRLVFLTLMYVYKQKFGITILAVALMFDHFHGLVKAATKEILALFVGTMTGMYAKLFNNDTGRKGPLFRKAYGNATKTGAKKIRTCIAYIFNNSVEKKLFGKAEDDRWNLLAYLLSDHPFSEPIKPRHASRKLLRSMKEADSHFRNNNFLNYSTIRRLFRNLDEKEYQQLMDYIIVLYLPIDKEEVLSYYKSAGDMVLAINSNTGSEYEVDEEYDPESHCDYAAMEKILSHSSYADNPHCIVSAPLKKKADIARILKSRTGASDKHIARFLHLQHPSG